jgi:hypothetical protein
MRKEKQSSKLSFLFTKHAGKISIILKNAHMGTLTLFSGILKTTYNTLNYLQRLTTNPYVETG